MPSRQASPGQRTLCATFAARVKEQHVRCDEGRVTEYQLNMMVTFTILLVFDDLHRPDEPTLLLVRHVVRSARTASMCIMATYRATSSAAHTRSRRCSRPSVGSGSDDRHETDNAEWRRCETHGFDKTN